MSGGFRVDCETVQAHARAVEELAGRVARAREASRYTARLSDDAFGRLGEIFAHRAREAMERGTRDLADLAGAGTALARGLQATAACYQQVERSTTALFGPRR